MRVGLTGATGFIGSGLGAALESRGDTVIRFVRPGSPAPAPTVRWDPSRGELDAPDLARAGLDAVVHLAGAGIGDRRWTPARKSLIHSSRVDGTGLLAAALRDLAPGPPFVAAASAIGVYGSRADEVLTEESGRGEGFLADLCVEWEAAARTGGPVAHLRSGFVLSAAGGALARQLPLFRLGLGGPLGSGAQWLSPLSRRDEVGAILHVLDRGVTGPVNVVGPAPATSRDFARALGRALHRPARLAVPAWALKLALGSELVDEVALASQRAVPAVLIATGYTFRDPDLSAILRNALADRT
ncbi:MAG TPA: TIGR01777 family oxidoreductase [Acidimicrobiales bacterium]|nr:TIGR01777 family oxidoreductase [Acidimicrobiales bacterium]